MQATGQQVFFSYEEMLEVRELAKEQNRPILIVAEIMINDTNPDFLDEQKRQYGGSMIYSDNEAGQPEYIGDIGKPIHPVIH